MQHIGEPRQIGLEPVLFRVAIRGQAQIPDHGVDVVLELRALAASLNNLGNRQSAFEQRYAALASTQEALGLYRKLAQARPEAFLPDLAMSLNNLGAMQSALGQREAALASATEAVNAIWPFFLRLPAAFERLTGMILDNLRKLLEALGQPPTAELLERIATFAAKRTS